MSDLYKSRHMKEDIMPELYNNIEYKGSPEIYNIIDLNLAPGMADRNYKSIIYQ